ncbi:hypothetical protein PSACC_01685 [Paramicrosporidium saccamoebae]|uniref:Uncharacterized protein n=1 Tax=Paramicrosporidium saccamoebae TaxID=1246581 RepID=A0A2H9TLD6_9FUNG|nr:hypothetical protein PSACC_01685 [Paramicrosporidium saccamoebae]
MSEAYPRKHMERAHSTETTDNRPERPEVPTSHGASAAEHLYANYQIRFYCAVAAIAMVNLVLLVYVVVAFLEDAEFNNPAHRRKNE